MKEIESFQIFFELDRPLLVVCPSFFTHVEYAGKVPEEPGVSLDIVCLGNNNTIDTTLEYTTLWKAPVGENISLKQGYSILQMSYDYYYLRYLQEEYRRCTGYDNANLTAFMKKEFKGPIEKIGNQWFFFYDGTEVTFPEIKVIEKNP